MLADMPISVYWGWVEHVRLRGLPFQNTERLLQYLNAGVLNASGRYQPVSPSDFSLQPNKGNAPACGQAVLTQMLSDMSSLSFEDANQ
ncbi:hypothetical protein LCX39_004052 [Vibrio vulnificus]|nr:hypothetical protein [Vibrio vulnificus]EIE1227643.1 hypothetical protein [Vibrio vulnificus]